jgi:hypothetical protein
VTAAEILAIALAFVLGIPVGLFGSLRLLRASLTSSAAARDFWVKAIFDKASVAEVQRWRRGEFLS